MNEPIPLTIRFETEQGGRKANLTIAELGVALTAVNRALNKAAAAKIADHDYASSAQAKEPNLLVVGIVAVENGSVLLAVMLEVGAVLGSKVLSADFVASILANGAYDTIKLLGKELKRAGNRIGHSAQVSTRIDPVFDEADAAALKATQARVELEPPKPPVESSTSNLASASKRISVTLTLPSGATAAVHVDYNE